MFSLYKTKEAPASPSEVRIDGQLTCSNKLEAFHKPKDDEHSDNRYICLGTTYFDSQWKYLCANEAYIDYYRMSLNKLNLQNFPFWVNKNFQILCERNLESYMDWRTSEFLLFFINISGDSQKSWPCSTAAPYCKFWNGYHKERAKSARAEALKGREGPHIWSTVKRWEAI